MEIMGKMLAVSLSFIFLTAHTFAADPSWIDARYSINQMSGQSRESLRLLRNEIFARHGRVFESQNLKEYFAKQPWYKPDPKYRDSALSKEEQALVRQIQTFENTPTDEEVAKQALAGALARTKAGSGIPDRIGNVVLGSVPPPNAQASTFLEFPGSLRTVLDQDGKVVFASFDINIHAPWDDDSGIVAVIQKRFGGSPPSPDSAERIWTNGKQTLRLWSFGASGYSSYYAILHLEQPGVPGSKKDGFGEFLDQFYQSLRSDNAIAASKFFLLPWPDAPDDRSWRGPITFSSEADFVNKFPELKTILLESKSDNSGAITPNPFSANLTEDGSYWIFDSPNTLLVKQVGGKWKIIGFVYTG